MKTYKPNINYITDNNLCTGCGICQDACPQQAIKFEVKKGLNIPRIDNDLCTNKKGCSRCYDICPGKGIELKLFSEKLYSDSGKSLYDYYIGYYNSCFSGYSLNNEIRFHSASGGLLSQFLIYLLKKELITGAVVTGFDSYDAMKPLSYIAESKEDILNAKSSKYCPVSLNGMATHIKQKEGKFIVVGLPCHIQGFRNLEKKDKRLKSKILGYFAIYCSSNRSFYAQDYITSRYSIDRDNLKCFAYRDEGCLGYLKAEHNNDRVVKVPFRTYYHSMRSFFRPKRCLTCIDHYGDLADVCFGDIQVGDYKKDKIGVNSLIVRSSFFLNILENAKDEGYIEISPILPDIVNESQKVMLRHKREVSNTVIYLDRLLFKKTPLYDIKLINKINFKSILSVILTYTQQFIGRYKGLWFIIDIFKKNNNENTSYNK